MAGSPDVDRGPLSFFATAPRGVEPILEAELAALGISGAQPRKGGVAFGGDLADGCRACLWSRSASRILLLLVSVPADTANVLYEGVIALAWEDHLSPDSTLAVDFVGRSEAFAHSRFGAQKVKDAIVDRMRLRTGRRPSVDLLRPDLRVNIHLARDQAQVALDLSGEALHRRGYREETGIAPLKENLAAALLLKVGWPDLAAAGAALLDPMCGSGTLPIEAALMAADLAPGLTRQRWGLDGWLGRDPILWGNLLDEARSRAEHGLARLPTILGRDADSRSVRIAQANAARAGLGERVRFERCELAKNLAPGPSGLVITNPPYGERLDGPDTLGETYAALGDLLKQRFAGWRAAVFTGNSDLGKRMGLRARKRNHFFNGSIPCVLLQFEVARESFVDREAADRRARDKALAQSLAGAEDFLNRVRKNLKTLGRWAARQGLECYRLYDADIPEFAVAVDIYGPWVHVQEYAPPKSVDASVAARRLEQIMTLLPLALDRPRDRMVLKVRRRQRGTDQYQRQADRGEWQQVSEGPAKLWVNLTDYLDTGLFLDHRPTRLLLGERARGKRFLNLFCYTGAATVHAALGGAVFTVSVDLSKTYLDWTGRNLALNGIGRESHQLIRSDCREWVKHSRRRFDLIFLDPPTFSTSKRMEGTWDVQRDHVDLIRETLALLAPGGTLVFSSNLRSFRLDEKALSDLDVQDVSRNTLPRDFARSPRIHQCFLIRRLDRGAADSRRRADPAGSTERTRSLRQQAKRARRPFPTG